MSRSASIAFMGDPPPYTYRVSHSRRKLFTCVLCSRPCPELLKGTTKGRVSCSITMSRHIPGKQVLSGPCWADSHWLVRVDSVPLSPALHPLMLCCQGQGETEHIGSVYTTKVGKHHKHIFFPPGEHLQHTTGTLLTNFLSD